MSRSSQYKDCNFLKEANKTAKARILFEKTWEERIASLKFVLEEAGIDAIMYLRNANIIDDINDIIPIPYENGSSSFLSSLIKEVHFL